VTDLFGDELGNYADLTQLPANSDVSGHLRTLNSRYGAASPRLWQLVVEFDDDDRWGTGPAVWLEAGIAGSRGALIWVERGRTLIPATGAYRLSDDRDWLPYLDWSGTPCSVRGAASVPVEQVFAAVEDVVASRRCPTAVGMVEVDSDRYQIVGPRQEHDQRHGSTFHRIA
jgi:hypothetical protein